MENQTPHHRPSWDEYFLNIADMVGSRGTCDRGRLGCVIVKDKRIIATGYVGSPAGISHCDEIGHEMHTITHEDGHQSRHCIRTIHAEQNAICQAAREGISLDGATIYQKMTPCYVCAKMIINAGIRRVVCQKIYHGSGRAGEIFAETGVQYKILSNEMEVYTDMKPTESAVPFTAEASKQPISEPVAAEPTPVPPIIPIQEIVPTPETKLPTPEPVLSSYAAKFTPISKILKADMPL